MHSLKVGKKWWLDGATRSPEKNHRNHMLFVAGASAQALLETSQVLLDKIIK